MTCKQLDEKIKHISYHKHIVQQPANQITKKNSGDQSEYVILFKNLTVTDSQGKEHNDAAQDVLTEIVLHTLENAQTVNEVEEFQKKLYQINEVTGLEIAGYESQITATITKLIQNP